MNRKLGHLVLIVVSSIFLCTCTATRSLTIEDQIETLGTIGVARGQFSPFINVKISTSGKLGGTGRGAALGATEGLLGALQTADPYGIIILAPLFTIAGGVAGSIKGAIESETAGIAQESEPVIDEAVNAIALQISFQDRVINDLDILTNQPVIPLTNFGPMKPGENVIYTEHIDSTVDTVLEIAILEVASIRSGWGTEFALSLSANARLIRLSDGVELINDQYKFTSNKHSIQSWASDNGRLVHSAYSSGIQILSRNILSDALPTAYLKLDKEIGTYCPNADLGHSDAQKHIGDLYFFGALGLNRDYIQAYVWYSLAANNGDKRAAPRLFDTVNLLTPEQLVEAKHRLESWVPGECAINLRESISLKGE